MRWIPARRHSARGEADGLWRWRPLSGPLRLSWPVPPRAAAAPSDRAWVDPDRSAISLSQRRAGRRAGPEAQLHAERGRRGERGRRARCDPLRSRGSPRASRPTGADDYGRHRGRSARRGEDSQRPSSPVLRAPDRPAKRPTLRQARLAPEPTASEPRPVRKAAADAREGAGKREAERTASSARAQRRASRAVAVNTRPEWAGAVAPARLVSVCLYYVVCF